MDDQNVSLELKPMQTPDGRDLVGTDGTVAPLANLSAKQREQVENLMSAIDLSDSAAILSFGIEPQREVRQVNEEMLKGVRNKDTGPAGQALNEMMVQIRGIETSDLKKGKEPGFFSRLIGKVSPIVRFMQQYETVENQIRRIEQELEGQRRKLLRDITLLDRLYESTLAYFHELELYIAAGKMRLEQVDTEEIPAARMKAEESQNPIDAQNLRDLQTARDDLERKVHDLMLTRQVVMQNLPSIRMTQELDKSLVGKIQSAVLNTIPLWKTQLAQAVTIFRTKKAAGSLKAASDLTNELLEANAENLAQANREVRTEVERGIFSIESIEQANQRLIESIEESIEIAEEGKARRAEAEQRLLQCETELKETLLRAV
jgi:uncharacterized protein YaaN involved in tellurite resistance